MAFDKASNSKWSELSMAKRITLFSLIFSFILIATLGALTPQHSEAKEHEAAGSASSAAAESTTTGPGGRSVTRAINGVQAKQSEATGMIYAPRDVVDMTRLVLEMSRDQTTHTAHYIEIATKVIVVFFSVLGAIGAAFGMHKIGDIENRAAQIAERIEREMGDRIQALHRELNNQAELFSAKAEVEIAISNNNMYGLANAATRIKSVLDRDDVSAESRIRGLADYAYAIKRTGDVKKALESISAAVPLAREKAPIKLPLLLFNAACYAAILEDKDSALRYLEEAISLNSSYKSSAQTDKDFTSVSETSKFKELIQS
jgi:hypothetical protein